MFLNVGELHIIKGIWMTNMAITLNAHKLAPIFRQRKYIQVNENHTDLAFGVSNALLTWEVLRTRLNSLSLGTFRLILLST
jgi:hypothetical protein